MPWSPHHVGRPGVIYFIGEVYGLSRHCNRVRTELYGAAFNLDVSLTGAVTNASTTGSVAYTAGDAIFAFITAEGSDGNNFHNNIQYTLNLEPA